MVFYIFALCIFAATQVLAEEDADVMACLELFKPENMEKECCEGMGLKEELEPCKDKDKEWECSNSKCFLGKLGILSGDTIDDKKVVDMLDKARTEHPEMKGPTERVQSHCLGGKFEDYPPKEACPLIKFQICSYINSVVECPSWKENDACKKMSENAKTCKSVLDDMQK